MKWLTDDEFFGTEVGTGVEDRALDTISAIAQNTLSSLATSPDFLAKMQVAFGNSFDVEKAVKLASAWAQGDFSEFPEIEIRSEAEINGALGAFAAATGKIYLSREFLAKNAGNVTAVAGVLLEEFGHFVDSQINRVDAIGDEGEIFSDLVQGKALSQGELAGLKGEDDSAVVVLDGKTIGIEQAEVSDSGGYEGSQETLKLDSKGGGIAEYSYEMYTIRDRLIIRYENKNILDTDFVSGNKKSVVSIPEGKSDELKVILATNDEGTEWNYKVSAKRKPVLIVPGFFGSQFWPGSELGLDPANIVTLAYKGLVDSLEKAGYKEGEDLFVAPYDWRLPPGPNDGVADGKISGISAASITDNQYEYSVDYLGHWLQDVAEKWKKRFPDAETLDSVDVIAHSTGGLVTRAYIQSDAYGGSVGDLQLPKVDNFIMLGVPNQGASMAWNLLNDDWDNNLFYGQILRNYVNDAYRSVQKGGTIDKQNAPSISLNSIQRTDQNSIFNPTTNRSDEKRNFIDQYIPGGKSLLAIDDFGVQNEPNYDKLENKLLLDLNAAGGSPVTSNSNVTIAYGTQLQTPVSVTRLIGPASSPELGVFFEDIQSLTDRESRLPEPGEVWYQDNTENNGDNTVTEASAFGPFTGVTSRAFAGVGHSDLQNNQGVQSFILDTLGASSQKGQRSSQQIDPPSATSSATTTSDFNWSFAKNSVEGFLVDANGKRLGYSQATGPVTEIPNSVWLGNNDGIGLIFGSVDTPVKLQLTGVGADQFVQVTGQQGTKIGSVESTGFLAPGEQRNLNVELTDIPQKPLNEPVGGDLAISKTVDRNSVNVGEQLTYNLTITNNGPNKTTGVTLTDYLSSGMNFVSATSSRGSAVEQNGVVNANLGDFNSGETATVTITGKAIATGERTATANVTSKEIDPNLSNNSTSVTTSVNPGEIENVDLELSNTVSNPSPNVGEQITFRIGLTNKGPGVASSIKVADILPPGLSFISANSIQGTYDSNTGIWDVGNMRDNLTRTLNINAQVNTSGSIITNATLLSLGENDINPGNNQASLTINTTGSDGSIPNQKAPILGTPGNDNLVGTFEPDLIYGLTGNDTIGGIGESDTIYGNQDDDVINGNQTNDLIIGGKGNDLLLGGKGNDQIYGDAGNDTLIGGFGQDILVGGSDVDTFVLPTKAAVVNDFLGDIIRDFQVGIDKIGLTDGLTFSNLILVSVENKTVIQIAENRQTLGVVDGVSPNQLSNSFVSVSLAGI